MELLLEILELIWVVITSESGSNALVSILFLIQSCILYGSVVVLMNNKRMQIRKEKSMDYVEATLEDLYSVMVQKYYSMASDVFGEDFLEEMEVQVVEYLYRKALDDRKSQMRKRVRVNGFDLKPAEEWRQYVEHEIKEDLTAVTNYLTAMWPRSAQVKRPFAYTENTKILDVVQHKLSDLYSELLATANKHKLKKVFFWRLTL